MDIFKFSIVFFGILAAVFHHFGQDPVALISLEASVFYFLMYLVYKSENK